MPFLWGLKTMNLSDRAIWIASGVMSLVLILVFL